jgi:hypothetical protein
MRAAPVLLLAAVLGGAVTARAAGPATTVAPASSTPATTVPPASSAPASSAPAAMPPAAMPPSAATTTAPAPTGSASGSPEAAIVASEHNLAPHDHPSLLDRPHTVAELEAGIIALPSAPISASNRGGATPLGAVGNGDATLQTGVHLLYRATREWAFGAGAMFAPFPTSDSQYTGGASHLQRTHKRSYLFLGGEVRYFPVRSRWIEAWFGFDAGGLVIGDRFLTDNAPQVPSILGTNEVTVSTEGFALGLQAGADYLINDNFVFGLALRGDRWFLPAQKPLAQETSCDPINDCPTLTGGVFAFELGLTFGYRIPL